MEEKTLADGKDPELRDKEGNEVKNAKGEVIKFDHFRRIPGNNPHQDDEWFEKNKDNPKYTGFIRKGDDGIWEMNILYIPFEDLSPVWQEYNSKSNRDTVNKTINEAIEAVHNRWMKENGHLRETKPELFVPFIQLPVIEKRKDLDLIGESLKLVNDEIEKEEKSSINEMKQLEKRRLRVSKISEWYNSGKKDVLITRFAQMAENNLRTCKRMIADLPAELASKIIADLPKKLASKIVGGTEALKVLKGDIPTK